MRPVANSIAKSITAKCRDLASNAGVQNIASTHIKRVSGSTRVDLSKSAATRAATQTFKPFKTAICSTTLTSKVSFAMLLFTDAISEEPEEMKKGLLLCELANGTQFTIPVDPKMKPPKIGSVITFTYDKLKGPNHVPTDAKLRYPRPDLCWDNVLAERFPYYLSRGKRSGQPTCRGCGNPVKDSKKLRVLVKSYFTPTNNQPPHPATYTFCAKASCIMKATEAGNTSKKGGAYYPPFNNYVYVPHELQVPGLEEDLATQTEGLKFAYGEKREIIEIRFDDKKSDDNKSDDNKSDEKKADEKSDKPQEKQLESQPNEEASKNEKNLA